MTDQVDTEALVLAVQTMAATAAGHRAELTRLDREIGDGDHGENLARGFHAVIGKLATSAPVTPGAVLQLVASTLISTVGGASGPLLGTAFLRAGSAVGSATELTGPLLATALEAARRTAEPLVLTAELRTAGGRAVPVEILLAPLRAEAVPRDRILGCLQPLQPLSVLNDEPLQELELVRLASSEDGGALASVRLATLNGRRIA